MAEQDGKPSVTKSLSAPVSGGDGAQPGQQPGEGTAPKQCALAGVYAVSLRDFQGKLQLLANAQNDPGVSAKSGDGAGSSAKKQGAACSGQSNS